MHYGFLQGEVSTSCHVRGGTGIVPAVFLGKPFNALSVTRVSPGAYEVFHRQIPLEKCAKVAISDQGAVARIVAVAPQLSIANLAGQSTSIFFTTPAGTPVDTSFYLVIVRTKS